MCIGKVKNRGLVAAALLGVGLRGRLFAAALPVLIAAYLLFHLRLLGAGDGKTMAVIAGYLGLERGLGAIAAGMAIGAAWALLRLRRPGCAGERIQCLRSYVHGWVTGSGLTMYCDPAQLPSDATIPLAACLALGTYLYLFADSMAMMRGGIF